MRRPYRLFLGVCLLAPLWSGCQTSRQTAQTEPARSGSFWSAEGEGVRTKLVTNRDGVPKVRFASRPAHEGGSALSNFLPTGGSEDRIPLPRTDDGLLRDIDAAGQSDQPIGAF